MRYFIIFLIIVYNNNLLAQTIITCSPSIVKNGTILKIRGLNINAIQYKNYPDSGILNSINKYQNPINQHDTIYEFLVPLFLKNKLYQILPFNYSGVQGVPQIIRVINFITDSVGLTIWGATANGISVIPDTIRKIVFIGSGNGVTFVLKEDGSVIGWGNANRQQLDIPFGLKDVVDIRGGNQHVLALKSNGSLVSWGSDRFNVVTNTPSDTFGFISMTTGSDFSCAVRYNNKLKCWGEVTESSFVRQFPNKTLEQISGGEQHVLMLYNDGTIESPTFNPFDSIQNIPNLATQIIKITAGFSFNTVLKNDGTILAWGDNTDGQTRIPYNLKNVVDIANSSGHTIALKSDSTVEAWGDNSVNQTNIPQGLSNIISINSNSLTARNLVIHLIEITTQIDQGGVISPKRYLRNGDNFRVTYTTSPNYRIDSIFINGIYNEAASSDSLTGFTFYQVLGLSNIYVKLKRLFYLNFEAINGQITPSTRVDSFSNFEVIFKPNFPNYFIDSILINDSFLNYNYRNRIDSILNFEKINKDMHLKIVYASPLPPEAVIIESKPLDFCLYDSSSQDTLKAKLHVFKNKKNPYFKLNYYQWYASKTQDTTTAVPIENAKGLLNTTDTVIYFLIPKNKVDSLYYFIKIKNEFNLEAVSNFSERIIIKPLPSSTIVFNNNEQVLCLPIGDSNAVNFHFINPNNEPFSFLFFEHDSMLYRGNPISFQLISSTPQNNYRTNIFKQENLSKKFFYAQLTNNYQCSIFSKFYELQWFKYINIQNIYFNDSVYCGLETSQPLKVTTIGLNNGLAIYKWWANNRPTYNNSYSINLIDSFFFPFTNRINLKYDTTYYWVIAIDKYFNCASDTLPLFSKIIINYPKITMYSFSDTSKVCKGIEHPLLTLQTNSLFQNNVNYSWYKNTVPQWHGEQYLGNNSTLKATYDNVDTSFYFCVIESQGLCSGLKDTSAWSAPFITYPYPKIDSFPTYFKYCFLTENTSKIGWSYLWKDSVRFLWTKTVPLDGFISNQEVLKTFQDTLIPQYYIFEVINSIGCKDTSKSIKIDVNPFPKLMIDSLGLPLKVVNGNLIQVKGIGGSYLEWFLKDTLNSVLSYPNQPIKLLPKISQFIVVKATDTLGCSYTDSFWVQVLNDEIDIYPSSLVTPNHDGINESWYIKNIEFFPNNTIVIYSDEGVFAKSFLNYHPLTNWPSYDFYFNQLENGQYFYIIKLFDSFGKMIRNKKGGFTVRR